jgi:hypothetical protein
MKIKKLLGNSDFPNEKVSQNKSYCREIYENQRALDFASL